jgi:hypothetical protein
MTRPVSVGTTLPAAVLTTVYIVPVGYFAKWSLMYLFNNTGSTKNIAVYWRDSSANANIYVTDSAVTTKNFVRIDGGAYVVMEENDSIVMLSEAGSTFTTICTFELFKKEGI